MPVLTSTTFTRSRDTRVRHHKSPLNKSYPIKTPEFLFTQLPDFNHDIIGDGVTNTG